MGCLGQDRPDRLYDQLHHLPRHGHARRRSRRSRSDEQLEVADGGFLVESQKTTRRSLATWPERRGGNEAFVAARLCKWARHKQRSSNSE